MTEPIIIDTCPVLGCGEKLQASAIQEKWYQDCTFRWDPDPFFGEAALKVEFEGHYYGENPDIEHRLYCGGDHTPEQIASAIAQRFARPTTPDPTIDDLRAIAGQTMDQLADLLNRNNHGEECILGCLDDPDECEIDHSCETCGEAESGPATTSRSTWRAALGDVPHDEYCDKNPCTCDTRTDTADGDPTALHGGRCAAQANVAAGSGTRWVQCTRQPYHREEHIWGTDNQVTPAEPFA